MSKFVLAVLLCGLMFPVSAEVYLLAPGRGKGRSFRADELAGARQLMREKVAYNGIRGEIEVYQLSRSLDVLMSELRTIAGELHSTWTPNGVAVTLPPEKGWQTMLLLFGREGQEGVTMFAMRLPEKRQENLVWPELLPLPGNAVPVSVMYFPESDSYFGSFRNGGDRRDSMLAITSALYSAGYKAQTGESAMPDESRGETFVSTNPRRILLLKLNDHGEGYMILRPL